MDFLRVFQFPGNKDKSLLDMTLNSNLKKKKKKTTTTKTHRPVASAENTIQNIYLP